MSNENGVNGCIRLKIVVGPIYSTVALLVFGVLMAATVPEGSPSTVRWRTSTTVHSVEEALEAQREASDNIIHTLSGVGTLSVDPNAPNPALGPFASKWGFSGNSYPIVFVSPLAFWNLHLMLV
ncbi:hypothetical protein BJ742DRAFT_43390 [Cladochytrium replicatum]|nr:hypothetical protein BJ742DRAFT_43390 [Cladochytrium replicatum]